MLHTNTLLRACSLHPFLQHFPMLYTCTREVLAVPCLFHDLQFDVGRAAEVWYFPFWIGAGINFALHDQNGNLDNSRCVMDNSWCECVPA